MLMHPTNTTARALTVIFTVLVLVGLLIWYVQAKDPNPTPTTTSLNQAKPEVAAATTGEVPVDAITAKYAAIVTSQGTIVVELYPDSALKTVANFATLAKRGYYDGLTFHRVVKDFVIQGGDPKGDGSGGESIYGPSFEDEINAESLNLSEEIIAQYEQRGYEYRTDITSHPMQIGSIAMANSGPNTNGSQFFIVTGAIEPPGLDGRHTVFGQVVEGMDVVTKINTAETGGARLDTPKEAVTITTIVPGDTLEQVKQTP